MTERSETEGVTAAIERLRTRRAGRKWEAIVMVADLDPVLAEVERLGYLLGSHADGHRCTCTTTDPKYWMTVGGATEPGSMYEQDPWCKTHPDMDFITEEVERLRAEVERLEWRRAQSREAAKRADASAFDLCMEIGALRAEQEALHSDETRGRLSEAIATHTPDLVSEGPNGEDDGQHLYCVECGVLPVDALGLQYGPEHVADAVLSVLSAGSEASR